MTFVEKVRKEIIKSTEKSANKILSEAEQEKNMILQRAKDNLKEKKDLVKAELKQYKDTNEALNQSEASSYEKRKRLEVESKVLGLVYDSVSEKLEKLDQSKRKEHLKLIEGSSDFPNKYCSAKDSKIIKAKTTDIIGGLILENKDSTQRVDLSYDSILEDIKKNSLSEIYKVLFENGS